MSESKWREAVWQPMAEHVLRHMGYTDAEIERYVPPPNHEAMGCEFDSNHMRWDCYDENDTSRHPNHDDVGQVVEIVGVALEADALSPVLAQMKREWQAEAWDEGHTHPSPTYAHEDNPYRAETNEQEPT